MQYPYFRKTDTYANSTKAIAILIGMLLALILAPKLVFAEEDPLPRYLLSIDDINHQVSLALQEKGAGKLIEATLDTDDPNTMFGADEPIAANVNGLKVNPRTRQWSANILFKNGEKILSALPMKGRFNEMVELPVLARTLATGQTIDKDDIILQTFPVHYQRAGVVQDSGELIGKSVRRNISKHRPIRAHEVSSPIVIKKNELVSLSYANENLTITTTGQVLSDAAVGDVIEVKNVNSNKTIRAVINDAKTASVMPLVPTTTALKEGDHEYN